MRKFLIPLILVASVGASSLALAAPTTTEGTIKAMDAKACTVTLNNNDVYQFAPKCDFAKLKVGEKVGISWTMTGKVYEASAIKAG